MRFVPESSDGANAGLEHARKKLEKVKEKYPNLSYADLWILASYVAIEEMGGPKIEFKGIVFPFFCVCVFFFVVFRFFKFGIF